MQYKNGSGGTPMKILIIEDEKLLADSLKWAGEAALCVCDHGVSEAANRFNGKGA